MSDSNSTTKVTERNIRDRKAEQGNSLVWSYKTLRNFIGFCGILLPLILWLFTGQCGNGYSIEPSISDYYYTCGGEILVMVLAVMGSFLITYNGYGVWTEVLLYKVAGLCALGIAFFPTAANSANGDSVHSIVADVPGKFDITELHLVVATTFFVCTAIICFFFFTRDANYGLKQPTHTISANKHWRNRIYYFCGAMIVLSLVILFIHFSCPTCFGNPSKDAPFVAIWETVALEAFGLAWLTKGETLFPDGEHYAMKGLRSVKRMFQDVESK